MNFPVEVTPATKVKRKLLPFDPRPAAYVARTPEEDAKINILVGAVRSAKTWAQNTKILAGCFYEVDGVRLLTGVSKDSIHTNVLLDLFEIIGADNYHYNRLSGDLVLFGVKWKVIGAKDEGSEKYIRGATVGYAVCDELVLMPKNFFMMLFARMSPAGARLYGTTNPDTPFSWLLTDVIESKELQHGLGKDIWTQTWTMDDNPHLSAEYKGVIKRMYTGVFYKRFILGLWVLATGSIYGDCFDEDNLYDDSELPKNLKHPNVHLEHWIPVDYGTTNPCTWSDVYDDGKTLWFDREYYFDSKEERRQKTDGQYADDMVAFCGGVEKQNDWPGIIIDPSAASFKLELMMRGFHVVDADNDVSDGIRRVSTMCSQKNIKVNRKNRNTIREMQTYSWDSKRAENGNEQPLKKNDHTCDKIRYYVNTRINDWRIATGV